MKAILLMMMGMGLAAIACGQPGRSRTKAGVHPSQLFTKADADKIMGEPTHLSDSSSKEEPDKSSYLCGYLAEAVDTASQRTGAIYFLMEEYHQESDAQRKYSDIKKANEHLGVEPMDELGDEAYFHSDGQHFYFIMVRKGNKVFNLKVNKITSTTSLEAFKQAAKKIVRAI